MPDERRLAAVEREIAEISQTDIRVRLIGTVVDVQDDRLVLDDGTARVHVHFDKTLDVKPEQLVRIIGRVIPLENGIEIQGEICQALPDFDLKLWKKIRQLESEIYKT